MSAAPTQPPTARAPKASFASRLFGNDVFVSFALGAPPRGTQSYASDLARRLRERDLSVFFSEDEAAPGEALSGTLERALRRAKLLVMIVNRGTLQVPNWVRTEVETFRARCPGRPVVPVCLDGSLREPALSGAVQPWLQHAQHIWLDERAEDAAQGLASEALVARLLGAPRRLCANTLWRALVVAVGFGLATLAALAAWQAVVAKRQRDHATALRDQGLSRQLAAQSAGSLVPDPVRALLLAAQSQAVVRSTASDGALLGALAALPLLRLQQHGAALQTLALQPHGDTLLLSDVRGAVLRGALGKPALDTVVPPSAGLNLYATVHAIAFAPDGRSWAQTGSSREISVHTAALTRTLPDGDKIGETTLVYVFGLAFSPDGASLAAASSSHAAAVRGLAFAADGRTLVSAGEDGRLLITLPVDRGRWQRRAAALPGAVPAEVKSPDGRWIAWPGTLASKPSAFAVDLSRLSAAQLPRLTVLRGADRQPVVDGAELPAAPGERVVAGPVFAADSSQLTLQVGARLLFWDLAAAEPLDAALALPPGARLGGASTDAPGWLAATDAKPGETFFFDTDRGAWARTACALAGRGLTREEWRRHVGDDRPYAPACAPG